MKDKYHSQIRTIAKYAYGSSEGRKSLAKKTNRELILNKGEIAAYRDNKEKKIYIGHRGTYQKQRKDITADLAIGVGLEKFHPRFKRARREVHKIEQENPGYQLVHTGHSLGGALAEHTGKKHSEIVTFNKAAGILSLVRKRKPNQTDYINILDPASFLSGGQWGGKVKKQLEFYDDPHKIESSTSKY